MKTTNGTCIKAMPTEYKGIQMKSRFEAQAAFLFDCLGWDWQYEPGSYMLPNGVAYLPDFLVKSRGLFIECRGYATPKGEMQLEGFSELVKSGIEDDEWGRIHQFLILRGNSEATFYNSGRHCGMVLVVHCKECGWRLPGLSRNSSEGMEFFQAFCPCCIAPMSSPSWHRWDGKARINATAIITVSDGKILVNGAGSNGWGWLSLVESEMEEE